PSPLRQTTQPHTLGERAPQKPLCVWQAPHGEAIMPLLSSLGCSLHVSTHTHTHTYTHTHTHTHTHTCSPALMDDVFSLVMYFINGVAEVVLIRKEVERNRCIVRNIERGKDRQ